MLAQAISPATVAPIAPRKFVRKASRSTVEAPRADIYQEVTDRIIAQLEAGVAPWAQPWSAQPIAAATMPTNAATGRRYSGVNVLLLWSAQIVGSYPSSAWMTFAQGKALGGMVRKGEKGAMVVYADKFIPKGEAERAQQTGDDAKAIAFLKRFTVFNIAQFDGLPERITNVEPTVMGEREQIEAAEQVIAASGVEFRVGGDKAFYAPGADFVMVPHQTAFHEQINYYRTVCHELTHATGHKSRLDRNLLNRFGSPDYAREELVAEMGSAFLNASLGINPTVRHADYIGSWLTVLREDKRAIFKAASAATKAADWLLSRVEG